MTLNASNHVSHCAYKKPVLAVKPFTQAELLARSAAETYYALAREYTTRGDTLNAVSCCIEASDRIAGIARPLVVRDQLMDLIRAIDPVGRICSRLRHRMSCAATNCAYLCSGNSEHQYLERLVSVHQLVGYPSGDSRFNTACESAYWQLRQDPDLKELYVVVYRSGLCSTANDRYFVAVPATMISEHGPHFLTDICAVVRN